MEKLFWVIECCFQTSKTDPNGKGHAKTNIKILLQINCLYTHGTENQVVACCDNYSPLIEVACEDSVSSGKRFVTSTNDPLANIMQTQGRNFFSVRAFGADDRISNPKKKFPGQSVSQSAQSSKFEIHHA